MKDIIAEKIEIGKHVRIGKNVKINGGFNYSTGAFKPIKKIILGDGVFLGDNVKISCLSAEIDDYTMICDNTHVIGHGTAKIGSCCWFGEQCILNTHGDLEIGNGVGVGAHSQLWTHILFGDTLQGCRWASKKKMIIEDDVWFVGHCLVSPIYAEKKSMAMLGSVVTHDMKENHVYGGVPAVDITDKVGLQFKKISVNEKYRKMKQKLLEFYNLHPNYPKTITIVKSFEDIPPDKTVFDVSNRTYTKRLTMEEIEFMKFLLTPIKFYPKEE